MRIRTALACLSLLVAVAHAAPTLQYDANVRQVSFLLPVTPSRAVTFTPEMTLAEVQAGLRLLGACEFVDAASNTPSKLSVATETATIYDVLAAHRTEELSLAVRCTGAAADGFRRLTGAAVSTTAAGAPAVTYPVTRGNTDWRDALSKEQVDSVQPLIARFYEYVRGALPEGSIPAREYPFDLIDYLHNTLDASWNWLITFLVSHWGDLHPFNTYTGKDADTGLWDLTTGTQMTQEASANLAAAGAECWQRHSANGATPSPRALAQCGAQLTGVAESNAAVRLALTADWGSGTDEAQLVSNMMINATKPHYTVHIGDIYYVGEVKEVRSNVLGEVPSKNVRNGVNFHAGSRGMFAFQGNHEMYSRGFGYYDHQLPRCGVKDPASGKALGQKGSYGSLDTPFWRIIGLDTGYNTYNPKGVHSPDNKQPEAVVAWLKDIVRLTDPADRRGIIILTHHQYRSAFEAQYLSTPKQLAQLLGGRTVIWLWGHEHHLAWYDLGNSGGVDVTCYGRCIGVGGFPIDIVKLPKDARAGGIIAQDTREYEVLAGSLGTVPIGFNGWNTIELVGNSARVDYYTLATNGDYLSRTNFTKVVTENFIVNKEGSVELTEFTVLDKGITVYDHVERPQQQLRTRMATKAHGHTLPQTLAARTAAGIETDVGNGFQSEDLRAAGVQDVFAADDSTHSTKKMKTQQDVIDKAYAEYKRLHPEYVEPQLPI